MITDRKTPAILLVFDAVATIVVFNVISHYRGVTAHFVLGPLLTPFVALGFALYLIDGYRARTDMMSVDYTSLHAIALASAMVAILLLTFVFIPEGYQLQSSRGVIAFSFLVLIPLTLSYRRMMYEQGSAQRNQRSLVFLGDGEAFDRFREECRQMATPHPLIHTELGAGLASVPGVGGERLWPFAQVLREVEAGHLAVEAIVLRESNRDLPPGALEKLVRLYFGGVPTYTLELFHEVYWEKIPLYRLNPTWLFQAGFSIAREPVFERLKRASDILFSVCGLLLAAPIVAVLAVAIFAQDRGGVFFLQSRVGRNGVRFRAIKLRTMHAAGGGALYTQPGDARITRIGRWLRTSRLDELPQLWNVLVGDMSLIGPRAEWDRLVEEYERQIPCYYFRHLVKPGITGWAQVNYTYGANLDDTIHKLEYDLYYIRHFSFMLDASIVLKTIHVMLFGKGR
jgi:exopolysaccharide biosynthesis polyprenyl glycosylphosphotransferase